MPSTTTTQTTTTTDDDLPFGPGAVLYGGPEFAAAHGLEWERPRDETERRLVELAQANPYRLAGIGETSW